MRIRLRLLPFLLVAMLIIVAGSSMRTAHASVDITLNSRQYNGASVNLGQMYLDGQGPFNLPSSTRVQAGVHKIRYIPPAGFYMVAWEVDGVIHFPREEPLDTFSGYWGNDPTITAIYQKNGLPAYVGGVVLPTNALIVSAPYLAMIGLVATAAIAIKRRGN